MKSNSASEMLRVARKDRARGRVSLALMVGVALAIAAMLSVYSPWTLAITIPVFSWMIGSEIGKE